MPELVIPILTYNYIPFLTVDDLVTKLDQIKDLVDSIIEEEDSGQARRLNNKINALLKEDSQNHKIGETLEQEYRDQVILLSFSSLTILSDQEIESLFRSRVIFAFSNGIDVVKAAKKFVISYQSPKVGENFANIVMRALGYNQEILGNSRIKLKDEEKSLEPTVANWLRSYNSFFPNNLRRSYVEEGEYILKNDNVRRLDDKSRRLLEKLIQLYDFLRFPDLFALEVVAGPKLKFEKIGVPIDQKSGADFSLPETRLDLAQQEIVVAYQGNENQRKDIAKAEQKLAKKFKDDIIKLRAEFFKSVQAKDIIRTVAILRLLAQKSDLEKFLKEDEKLFKFLAVTWERQYGKDLAAEFKKNPAQFKFVKLFLQYVLQQRLGLSRSDAARFGMQIGNIVVGLGQPEYKQIAYFDVKSKMFNWFE